jgi:hypothetical protein
MSRAVTNVSASVREKLRQLSEARSIPFARLLERFVLERLLYRLSVSPFRENMVLKGAMLLSLWSQAEHRPTRDVDFLAYGNSAPEQLASVFRQLCTVAVDDDGLTFVRDSVKAQVTKEGQQYEGIRVEMLALVGVARVRVQADIGFGDIVDYDNRLAKRATWPKIEPKIRARIDWQGEGRPPESPRGSSSPK